MRKNYLKITMASIALNSSAIYRTIFALRSTISTWKAFGMPALQYHGFHKLNFFVHVSRFLTCAWNGQHIFRFEKWKRAMWFHDVYVHSNYFWKKLHFAQQLLNNYTFSTYTTEPLLSIQIYFWRSLSWQFYYVNAGTVYLCIVRKRHAYNDRCWCILSAFIPRIHICV